MESRPPKPPFDRERFVFKILAVVIGTQLLIYRWLPVFAASGRWKVVRSVRSAPTPSSSCRAALIPPSTSCWRCWAEQR